MYRGAQPPLAPRFNAAPDMRSTSPPLTGRGSEMVKQEQPKPALKPRHKLSELRKSFKDRWQTEYAAAKQEAARTHDQDVEKAQDFPTRAHDRG